MRNSTPVCRLDAVNVASGICACSSSLAPLHDFDSSVPSTHLVGWECGIDGIWSSAIPAAVKAAVDQGTPRLRASGVD
jgi:hypothetical protein